MNWVSITEGVLMVVPLAVIIYDVIAIEKGGTEASISAVVLRTSLKRPIVPFAVGVLCGHLFFSQVP